MRRLIERRKVLFPHPLGPMNATTLFCGIVSDTRLIASFFP